MSIPEGDSWWCCMMPASSVNTFCLLLVAQWQNYWSILPLVLPGMNCQREKTFSPSLLTNYYPYFADHWENLVQHSGLLSITDSVCCGWWRFFCTLLAKTCAYFGDKDAFVIWDLRDSLDLRKTEIAWGLYRDIKAEVNSWWGVLPQYWLYNLIWLVSSVA